MKFYPKTQTFGHSPLPSPLRWLSDSQKPREIAAESGLVRPEDLTTGRLLSAQPDTEDDHAEQHSQEQENKEDRSENIRRRGDMNTHLFVL